MSSVIESAPFFHAITDDEAVFVIDDRRYELFGLANNRMPNCLFARLEVIDKETGDAAHPERINLTSKSSCRNFAKRIETQLGHKRSFIAKDLELMLQHLSNSGYGAKKSSRPARQFGKSWSRA